MQLISSIVQRISWLILCIVVSNQYLYAQIRIDSIYETAPVEIEGYRYKDFSAGSKSVSIDSSYLKNNPGSLADVLSNQSSVYIKSYGMSSLASISVRGGSASQTLTTMNGMIINSPTTGQLDYSTVPSFLFNDMQLQYGSQVSLLGSGAIGGSIHLSNDQNFVKRRSVGLTFQQASYGSVLPIVSARIGDSTKQLYISTYYKQARNSIPYYNNGEKTLLDHASQFQKGIYLDYAFKIKNHTIKYWTWYQQMNRNLPGTINAPFSDATQYDRNWKQGIQWMYAHKRSVVQSRVGLQSDKMNYESDTSNIHSVIKSKIIQAELEYRYQLNAFVNFLAGTQAIFQNAQSDNFIEYTVHQNKMAFFVSSNIKLLSKKMNIVPSIRKEWATLFIPVTPSLGMDYQLISFMKLHGLASYNYRIPSLNDLYWNPGGNTSLKPEYGWGYEGGITLEKEFSKIYLYQDVTGYTRTISDWILWTPNKGIWTPDNIQRVWSRGIELESRLSITLAHYKLHFKNTFAYTKSTNESDLLSTDTRSGKQLIYVPLYKNSFSASIQSRKVEPGLIYNYTSWSFITSDNSDYLDPYHLFDAYMLVHIGLPKVKSKLTINARINNIFNKSYQVVASRPMPMRNYQLTISYTFN